MSNTDFDSEPTADEADTNTDTDSASLRAQIDLLVEENRRLRADYTRARQSAYRGTAFGLVGIGGLSLLAALLFPAHRGLLFAFAATGFFGGVLTYFITPERFVAAGVGERVYAAFASNQATLVDTLALTDQRWYVPTGTGAVRLFVPQYPDFDPSRAPDSEAGILVVEDGHHGLQLEPSGSRLLEAFEERLVGDLGERPEVLVTQLVDGVIEQFELADGADIDLDPEGGRVTVAITNSAFGRADRFDHPIPSFLATGLAVGLDTPVALECERGDDRAEWLLTCRWDRSGPTGTDTDTENEERREDAPRVRD